MLPIGDSPKVLIFLETIIAMIGVSRPEFCADRNRQLRFDQTRTVKPLECNLRPKFNGRPSTFLTRNEIWIAPLDRLGESFQTVLMTMGRKLPQGAQNENKFAAKPGKSGDSPKHEILPRWRK